MARVKLSPAQKQEIKILTQFMNRRIAKAQKVYGQYAKDIIPKELGGEVQLKDDWLTSKTPVSRSVKFDSEKDYRQRINFLRRYRRTAPDLEQYTADKARTTMSAMETSLGRDIPDKLRSKLNTLSAPELSDFWNTFSKKARRMGLSYSSDSAMQSSLQEFFPEDYENLLS